MQRGLVAYPLSFLEHKDGASSVDITGAYYVPIPCCPCPHRLAYGGVSTHGKLSKCCLSPT